MVTKDRCVARRHRSSKGLRPSVVCVAIVLAMIAHSSPAGAISSGYYRLDSTATIRQAPHGFFLGTLSPSDHFYTRSTAESEGFGLVYGVRADGMLKKNCGWISMGAKRTRLKSGTAPSCPSSNATTTVNTGKWATRQSLLANYANEINDVSGDYNTPMADRRFLGSAKGSCGIVLDKKVQMYANLSSWSPPTLDKSDPVTSVGSRNVYFWRYRVRGASNILVVAAPTTADSTHFRWGFIQIDPGQQLPHVKASNQHCPTVSERTFADFDNPLTVP